MKINAEQLTRELRANAANPNFSAYCTELTERLPAGEKPEQMLAPILDFMAENPGLDYGSPGAFVRFIETFPEEVYVDFLLASIRKRATEHNTWMLQRIMNTWSSPRQDEYIAFWKELAENPRVDANLRETLRDALSDFEE
jgi:hypothetical protein